jgi:xylulokinase
MSYANSDFLMLGLDLGTGGAKAGVIDRRGQVLSAATETYETRTPRPGWAEQDPEDWWRASARAISRAISCSGAEPSRIRGVGLSGQMHGSVFLDSAGRPVYPCIIWCDQRAAAQCEQIRESVGDDALAALVGNPALAGFTAPKVLWLQEREPESFARVRTILLPKDYVNLRLTGELATDVSDASGTLLFDVREREWSDGMLQRLGIRKDWLPVVLESGDEAGSPRALPSRRAGRTTPAALSAWESLPKRASRSASVPPAPCWRRRRGPSST